MKAEFNWDALGIATSLACAIHCAVLPLVLTSLPLFGVNIIDNAGFEYFMILLAFAVGAFSLVHGYRRHHRSVAPLLVFSAGFLFLLAKQMRHDLQYWLLPFAVVLIVGAHLMNYRSCRVARQAEPPSCDHGH